jgi:hypothetical protein
MPTVGKLICEWDTCDIARAQADFLNETGDYPNKTDDELFQMACEDPDLLEWNWRDLCDCLTNIMAKNSHGGWKAEVHNFGWRSLNGHKLFQASNGKELLREVLPHTDCTFKVYRYGRGLALNNAHHDSPTWNEWYYITPCKQALAA